MQRNLMTLEDEKKITELLLNLDQYNNVSPEHTSLAYIALRTYLKNKPELINMGMPSFGGQPPLAYYLAIKPNGALLILNNPFLNVMTNETLNFTFDGRSVIAPLTLSPAFQKLLDNDKTFTARISKLAFNYSHRGLTPASVSYLKAHPECLEKPEIAEIIDMDIITEHADMHLCVLLMCHAQGLHFLEKQPLLLAKFNLAMKHGDKNLVSRIKNHLDSKQFAALKSGLEMAGLPEQENHIEDHKINHPVYRKKFSPSSPIQTMSIEDETMLMRLLTHINTHTKCSGNLYVSEAMLKHYLCCKPELLNMGLPSHQGNPPFALYLSYLKEGRTMMLRSPLFDAMTIETLNYSSEDEISVLSKLSNAATFHHLFSQPDFIADFDIKAFSVDNPSAAYNLLRDYPELFENPLLAARVDTQRLAIQAKTADLRFFKQIMPTKIGCNLLMLHKEFRDRLNELLEKTDKSNLSLIPINALLKKKEFEVINRLLHEERKPAAAPVAAEAATRESSLFKSFVSFFSSSAPSAQNKEGYALIPDGP